MLHRSTSSRRCRASRNMTNLGHASTIAGPRGRRASVATDKPIDMPQTSPRGTMERQRSPRGSFVPDIALDTENDDETMNHRPLLDRDQYGGSRNMLNQKISRSPRNSLVPDDYYRLPRNGARSPRNSLIPDASLAPDMLYSSRHSLVPEAPMSPRNSLIPDVTHNRSPRNSLVPLTGSRTSLMSENGNLPPSRSPRHSLVPNSSRSPRGSITNMELVDRSPQRSPRGSIASECLNQSPRNSITPYTGEVNRSSRGSIGINDSHRGSIGGNEEETRSPRRSIDPDTIDRTPRGSLGGLQERRFTKANLMAQDPRRASADQGVNGNRNPSPSRQKDVNTGSVKSGGSAVQITLGYGPTVFEDSRRASSSVSQFSGDESRRLFTSGAKVPESKMENKNLGVITYGSVVFQLKDANLEANNICDFVFRALRVVCRTRVVTVYLIFLSMVPILMLCYGWSFKKDCPKEESIPLYMVIGGAFGTMLMALLIYSQIRSRRPEMLTFPSNRPQISFTKLIIMLLSCFLLGWFVMGNYWILHIMWPEYNSPLHTPDSHCDKNLYLFSLAHLAVVYITFGITLLVMTVLAFFRILACLLPER
ncbi:Transmembrane protein 272 [Anthophora quadrimaculata]